MKEERKDRAANILTNSSIPFNRTCFCFFSDEKNFSLDLLVNSRNNCFPLRCNDCDEKQTPSAYIGVWGSYVDLHATQRPTLCLVKVVLLWIERVDTGRSYVWQRTLRQSTQARKASLGSKKISVTTSPPTSGCLTLQITQPSRLGL